VPGGAAGLQKSRLKIGKVNDDGRLVITSRFCLLSCLFHTALIFLFLQKTASFEAKWLHEWQHGLAQPRFGVSNNERRYSLASFDAYGLN